MYYDGKWIGGCINIYAEWCCTQNFWAREEGKWNEFDYKSFWLKFKAKKQIRYFFFRNLKEYNDDCVFINSLDDGTSYCAGFEDHPPWPRCKGYVEIYIILLLVEWHLRCHGAAGFQESCSIWRAYACRRGSRRNFWKENTASLRDICNESKI